MKSKSSVLKSTGHLSAQAFQAVPQSFAQAESVWARKSSRALTLASRPSSWRTRTELAMEVPKKRAMSGRENIIVAWVEEGFVGLNWK